jgi:hypothetical protein
MATPRKSQHESRSSSKLDDLEGSPKVRRVSLEIKLRESGSTLKLEFSTQCGAGMPLLARVRAKFFHVVINLDRRFSRNSMTNKPVHCFCFGNRTATV